MNTPYGAVNYQRPAAMAGSLATTGPARTSSNSYRRFVSLAGGKKIMLRFLNGDDSQGIARLYREAREEETRLCQEDFKNPGAVTEWLEKVDYQRLFPLVAMDLDSQRLVGNANLYVGKNTSRHIGEITFFVAEPFRNLGLGSLMVDELLDLARRKGLHYMMVSIVAEQKKLIGAFRAKGFQFVATLEDFFMRHDGVTHDVVLMMRPVLQEGEKEF